MLEIFWLVVGVLGPVCVMLGISIAARVSVDDTWGVAALGVIAAVGMMFVGILLIVMSLSYLV